MSHRYQILQDTSLEEFVKFWAEAYDYPSDSLYTKNIGQPLTKERIHELFIWKNGGKLSRLKEKSVSDYYVSSISKLETIPKDTLPDQWLKDFGKGGAIWNIFFLHIWNPKFPIFDQHVFRAMRFIETGKVLEIPSAKDKKTEFYLSEYRPFYSRLETELKSSDPRDLDRALWKFGQFLKWLKPPTENEADKNSEWQSTA
jgi:hypothetical protein